MLGNEGGQGCIDSCRAAGVCQIERAEEDQDLLCLLKSEPSGAGGGGPPLRAGRRSTSDGSLSFVQSMADEVTAHEHETQVSPNPGSAEVPASSASPHSGKMAEVADNGQSGQRGRRTVLRERVSR